jgi:hypothetical protein
MSFTRYMRSLRLVFSMAKIITLQECAVLAF